MLPPYTSCTLPSRPLAFPPSSLRLLLPLPSALPPQGSRLSFPRSLHLLRNPPCTLHTLPSVLAPGLSPLFPLPFPPNLMALIESLATPFQDSSERFRSSDVSLLHSAPPPPLIAPRVSALRSSAHSPGPHPPPTLHTETETKYSFPPLPARNFNHSVTSSPLHP